MVDRSHIHFPDHPNANIGGKIRKYRLVAATALGKPLPPFTIIHHHGEDQIVICEDAKYHELLERREEALIAVGDVHKRKCRFCQQWDDIINLIIYGRDGGFCHKNCISKYWHHQWMKRKARTG